MQKPHIVMNIPVLDRDGTVVGHEHEIVFCPGSGNRVDWWEGCSDCTEKDKWEMRCAELEGIPEVVAHGVKHKRLDGLWMVSTHSCGPCNHPECLNLGELDTAGAGVFEVHFEWDEEWVAEVVKVMSDGIFQVIQEKNDQIADLEKINNAMGDRLMWLNFQEEGRIR